MQHSQNLPLLPRITPLLMTISDTPRIYPYILKYTPSFLPAICDPTRIHPSSQKIPVFLGTICNTLRIYPYIPEYSPPFFNNYMRPSQNLPSTSQNIPPLFNNYICDQPRIDPSLPEYTSLSLEIIRFNMLFFYFQAPNHHWQYIHM